MQTVFFGRLDHAIDRCAGRSSSGCVGEQPVFTPDHKRLNRTLAAVVVDLQPPVLQECRELFPLVQAVSNRLADQAFGHRPGFLLAQPRIVSIQHWTASLCVYLMTFFLCGFFQLPFNRKEQVAIRQPLGSHRFRIALGLRRCFQRFVVLAPCMRPAANQRPSFTLW